MLLKDKIVDTKPREKAGSTSGSRFDYQKDWSLCKLIECHETQSDYVIVFDWHEDLLIMNSEHNPEKVSFFQIKGKKSGNWTIAKLITSETGKDGKPLLSIIGKLYDCKTKYDLETTSLNFVSNARFSVNLTDNSASLAKETICIIELTSEEKEKLKSKLKEEHGLTTDPIYEEITFLKVLDLSLDDSKTHTQGKISDFLDSLYQGRKFNIPSVYRMLFDEVKRRANYNKEILSYVDLISNKSIGKSQFERIIDATGINKNFDEIWNRAELELQNDGLKFQDRRKLKQAWKKLEIERMDPNNDYLIKLMGSIKSVSNEQENNGVFNTLNLVEIMESIFISFNNSTKIPLSYDESFIKAIILSEIYE